MNASVHSRAFSEFHRNENQESQLVGVVDRIEYKGRYSQIPGSEQPINNGLSRLGIADHGHWPLSHDQILGLKQPTDRYVIRRITAVTCS